MKQYIGKEIKLTYSLLRRVIDSHVRQDDFTFVQGRILHYIDEETKKREVIQKDIEEEFHIRASSASQILQKLEKKGFIERIESPADKRIKRLRTTQMGSQAAKQIHIQVCQLEAFLIESVDPKDLAIFFDVLEKIKMKLGEQLLEKNNGEK